MAVPSGASPVTVTFTPLSEASLKTVKLLTGTAPGLNFDCSMFSFQVPIVLSAPSAAIVVIARPIINLVKIVRIFLLLGSMYIHACPAKLGDKIIARYFGHENRLTDTKVV